MNKRIGIIYKNTYQCPQCREQTLMSSGFNGNPFCWGKCYRYFNWKDIDVKTFEE